MLGFTLLVSALTGVVFCLDAAAVSVRTRRLLPSTERAARNPYLLATDSDQVYAEITRLPGSSHR